MYIYSIIRLYIYKKNNILTFSPYFYIPYYR